MPTAQTNLNNRDSRDKSLGWGLVVMAVVLSATEICAEIFLQQKPKNDLTKAKTEIVLKTDSDNNVQKKHEAEEPLTPACEVGQYYKNCKPN